MTAFVSTYVPTYISTYSSQPIPLSKLLINHIKTSCKSLTLSKSKKNIYLSKARKLYVKRLGQTIPHCNHTTKNILKKKNNSYCHASPFKKTHSLLNQTATNRRKRHTVIYTVKTVCFTTLYSTSCKVCYQKKET